MRRDRHVRTKHSFDFHRVVDFPKLNDQCPNALHDSMFGGTVPPGRQICQDEPQLLVTRLALESRDRDEPANLCLLQSQVGPVLHVAQLIEQKVARICRQKA